MKEQSIFTEYFGESPIIKILDFFIENDIFDYSKTDIYQHTGIARTTLQYILAKLADKKILIRTRTVGRAEMYKLNRGNPVVEEIVSFALNLAASVVKAELKIPELEIKA